LVAKSAALRLMRAGSHDPVRGRPDRRRRCASGILWSASSPRDPSSI